MASEQSHPFMQFIEDTEFDLPGSDTNVYGISMTPCCFVHILIPNCFLSSQSAEIMLTLRVLLLQTWEEE